MFRKSEAYFVSDKVLLQTKKLPPAFLHTNQRRRERERARRHRHKGNGKSNEKKRFLFDLFLFLPSIIFFFCFQPLHLVKFVFFFLPSSFSYFVTPQFSFFIQDLRLVLVIFEFGLFSSFFLHLRTLPKIRSNS